MTTVTSICSQCYFSEDKIITETGVFDLNGTDIGHIDLCKSCGDELCKTCREDSVKKLWFPKIYTLLGAFGDRTYCESCIDINHAQVSGAFTGSVIGIILGVPIGLFIVKIGNLDK